MKAWDPDVVTMAKGIASGFPISAVVTTSAIAGAWKARNISTRSAETPILVRRGERHHRRDRRGGTRRERRAPGGGVEGRRSTGLKSRYPIIGDVRGRGLMLGLELVRDEQVGDRTPAPDTTLRLLEEAKKRGLLLGRGGLYGNVVRVAPPLVVSRRDVDDALAIIQESFAATGARERGEDAPCRPRSAAVTFQVSRRVRFSTCSGLSPVPRTVHSRACVGAPTQCS